MTLFIVLSLVFCVLIVGVIFYVEKRDKGSIPPELDPKVIVINPSNPATSTSCGVTDPVFSTAALWDLGVTSGSVAITASGLPVGASYNVIYPGGGATIHTTGLVDGAGNLSSSFYYTYNGVNTIVEFIQSGT
jgi:hypothetical protein